MVVAGSGVALGFAGGVDPGRGDVFGVSVGGEADLPAAVVDGAVVVGADERLSHESVGLVGCGVTDAGRVGVGCWVRRGLLAAV